MQYDTPRPLEVPPPDARDSRVYADDPLVVQPPPEQRAFVDAYNRVGRPRITVFINRTMQGDIIPVQPNTPEVSIEKTRRSNTGVDLMSEPLTV